MAVQSQSQMFGFGAVSPEELRAVSILWVKHCILCINYCCSIYHAKSKYLLGANLQLRLDLSATSNVWIGEPVDIFERHSFLDSR